MSTRVIFVFLAFFLLWTGLTPPAQAFPGAAPHVEQAAVNALDAQPTQAAAETGAEQLEMLCFLYATAPAAMASTRPAPFAVNVPLAPHLDGPQRPPNASAIAC
jgi:hypothetical protein